MYILGANVYFEKVQPQWQLLDLFFWECTQHNFSPDLQSGQVNYAKCRKSEPVCRLDGFHRKSCTVVMVTKCHLVRISNMFHILREHIWHTSYSNKAGVSAWICSVCNDLKVQYCVIPSRLVYDAQFFLCNQGLKLTLAWSVMSYVNINSWESKWMCTVSIAYIGFMQILKWQQPYNPAVVCVSVNQTTKDKEKITHCSRLNNFLL